MASFVRISSCSTRVLEPHHLHIELVWRGWSLPRHQSLVLQRRCWTIEGLLCNCILCRDSQYSHKSPLCLACPGGYDRLSQARPRSDLPRCFPRLRSRWHRKFPFPFDTKMYVSWSLVAVNWVVGKLSAVGALTISRPQIPCNSWMSFRWSTPLA